MLDKKEQTRKRKEQINQQIIQLHKDHPEWSSKRISDEIGQSEGYVSHVIQKLWKEQRLLAKIRAEEEALEPWKEECIEILKERYFIERETVLFTTSCMEYNLLGYRKSILNKNKNVPLYSKVVRGVLCFTSEQIYCVNERDEILVFSYENPHELARDRLHAYKGLYFLLIEVPSTDPNKPSGKTWFRRLSSEAINKIDEIYVQKGKEIRISAKTIQVAVQRYCYECGAENPPHAKFCGRCGEQIKK